MRKILENISPTFDYKKISQHKNVFVLDEDGFILTEQKDPNISQPTQNKSGATCKRCGDYNPYAEIPADGNFICYSCKH